MAFLTNMFSQMPTHKLVSSSCQSKEVVGACMEWGRSLPHFSTTAVWNGTFSTGAMLPFVVVRGTAQGSLVIAGGGLRVVW